MHHHACDHSYGVNILLAVITSLAYTARLHSGNDAVRCYSNHIIHLALCGAWWGGIHSAKMGWLMLPFSWHACILSVAKIPPQASQHSWCLSLHSLPPTSTHDKHYDEGHEQGRRTAGQDRVKGRRGWAGRPGGGGGAAGERRGLRTRWQNRTWRACVRGSVA